MGRRFVTTLFTSLFFISHFFLYLCVVVTMLTMRNIWDNIVAKLRRTPRWAVITGKVIASLIIVALMAIVATSVSAVYNFRNPTPFSGNDIFNPYRNIDTTIGWKRAALHTHSRVEGIFNECDFTPKQIRDEYRSYGYEVVHFSNHNEHTKHPTEGMVHIYEHGYNIAKLHIHVYGSDDVMLFDPILPLFDFQRQFKLNLLAEDADIVQLNHPRRTKGLDRESMERLSGYRIMELSRIIEEEQREWDWALSAGRYSYGIYTDDMHFLDRTDCVARRSTMLNTPSESYDDVVTTLKDGSYYSLYTPDYGNGNKDVKVAMNLNVPRIRTVGESDGVIYVSFSRAADSIRFTGQNQKVLHTVYRSDTASYAMQSNDSYARITAYFADGERIYTNAFARYDATKRSSPFDIQNYSVNITLTIIYNAILLALIIVLGIAEYKLIRG